MYNRPANFRASCRSVSVLPGGRQEKQNQFRSTRTHTVSCLSECDLQPASSERITKTVNTHTLRKVINLPACMHAWVHCGFSVSGVCVFTVHWFPKLIKLTMPNPASAISGYCFNLLLASRTPETPPPPHGCSETSRFNTRQRCRFHSANLLGDNMFQLFSGAFPGKVSDF